MMFGSYPIIPPEPPKVDEELVREITVWWVAEYGMRSWQENVEMFLREYNVKRRGEAWASGPDRRK